MTSDISCPLTARHKEVVKHVASGKSNAQIAEVLFVAENTVEEHLSEVGKRLNIPKVGNKRMLIIRAAIHCNCLDLEDLCY
jgi:DNA-binding NarL/FixJ family response regulator